jgi:glycogen synthase
VKVLVVSSSFFPKIDGSTRCVYDHVRKLAERGNEVFLSTRGIRGAPKSEFLEGVKVRRSSVQFRESSLANKASLLLEQMINIIRLQRRERFSVIHVHGYVSGLAALPARLVFGVPVVITTHGTEFLWPKELWWRSPTQLKLELIFERFVLRNCDVVIAQSEGVRSYMLKLYGGEIAKKIRIVPTGVDHKKFNAPTRSGPGSRVLFVGALSEIKGLSCLLRAFKKVHDRVPESSLVLIGSGPKTSSFRSWVSEHGLQGAVEFEGPVRDDGKLVVAYHQSDIVVLPSNVGGPISCTILEGLSCGRAVISTDVPGGIPDVLGGGVGLLMRRGDDEQLASMLYSLMTDREQLLGYERSARAAVEEKYTLDSMVQQLSSLYEEIAS